MPNFAYSVLNSPEVQAMGMYGDSIGAVVQIFSEPPIIIINDEYIIKFKVTHIS